MTPEWTTTCPDWAERIVRRESLIPCSPLFPAEAEASLEVFRGLKIVDAPGSPTIGEVCLPWVVDFASVIFGACDPETGRRLIRYFMLLVSKKNSKSTIAAAIMLTALVRNWRQSAEFLILAPTIEVANNSFWAARDMVREDEELNELLQLSEHTRTIRHRNTSATLKVVAADSETVSGKKAVGIFVDELWLFGKRANVENMLREATGGLASRPEGFVIYASTQSDEPPSGIFKLKLDEFRDIRDGKIHDPKSLPVLYEFPKHMVESGGYRDPDNFYITNPNLGASVDEEFLRDEFAKAERAGKPSLIGFCAKHLNIEIGLGLRSDGWVGAEYWEKQLDRSITVESILERCEVVTVGIDHGGTDDLLGFHVLGREKGTGHWLAWSYAWCHAIVFTRRKGIASRLQDFADAGELGVVGNQFGDVQAAVAIIAQIKDAGLLGGVGIDPYYTGQFPELLEEIDVTTDNKLLIGIRQGMALMGAIKETERRLMAEELWHSESALADWCVSNVKIEAKATAIRPTKQHAGDAKVDTWFALMNAVEVMLTNPEGNRSIYDDPNERPTGLLII